MKLFGQILIYSFAVIICGGLCGIIAFVALSFVNSIEPSTKLFMSYCIALVGGLTGAFFIKNPIRFLGEVIIDIGTFISRFF